MTDETFDPASLVPQQIAADDTRPDPFGELDEQVPDHTAGQDEPTSIIERVKQRAKEREDKPAASTSTRARGVARKPTVPKVREGALVQPLTNIYTTVGMGLIAVDPTCGLAVVENAESCAKSLDKLAQSNDAVRRALLALTETSAWGGVIAAHFPLMLVVLMHHAPANVQERIAPVAAAMNAQPSAPSNVEPVEPEARAS